MDSVVMVLQERESLALRRKYFKREPGNKVKAVYCEVVYSKAGVQAAVRKDRARP